MQAPEPDTRDEIVRRCGSAARASFPRAFLEGLAAPWTGLRYMSDNPKLWRYGILPVAVNLLITGLLLALLIVGGVYFFPAIHSYFDGGFLWRIVEAFVAVAAVMAALVLLVVAWIVLQAVLCGWFYDRLARQVELRLGTSPDELKDAPLMIQAIDTLRVVGFLLLANAGCIVVQLIPVVGSVLGLCGSYYFTCSTLGFEFFDYPLSLRGLRRSEKLAFARRRRPYTLGLGTSVAVLAFVPIINAVFLTTAVTGAVLLHKRLAESVGQMSG
ncbi:MAG: EI24 domain-containing protein [Pirellulales bacterium]|nr:EI24 domain-containing protein [Pirellulales bacterium]